VSDTKRGQRAESARFSDRREFGRSDRRRSAPCPVGVKLRRHRTGEGLPVNLRQRKPLPTVTIDPSRSVLRSRPDASSCPTADLRGSANKRPPRVKADYDHTGFRSVDDCEWPVTLMPLARISSGKTIYPACGWPSVPEGLILKYWRHLRSQELRDSRGCESATILNLLEVEAHR
jgi:hypothetical protein